MSAEKRIVCISDADTHLHLAHRDDEAAGGNDKRVTDENRSRRQQRAVPQHVGRADRRTIPQLQPQDGAR